MHNFYKSVFFVILGLLLSFAPMSVWAGTRSLKEVNLQLEDGELLANQAVLGQAGAKLIMMIGTAQSSDKTKQYRRLLIAVEGTKADVLADTTDFDDDYTPEGAKVFSSFSAVPFGARLMVRLSEGWNSRYLVTDGTRSGTVAISEQPLGGGDTIVGNKLFTQRQEGPYSDFSYLSALDLVTGQVERILSHNHGAFELQKLADGSAVLVRGLDDLGVTLWRSDGSMAGTSLLIRTPAPSYDFGGYHSAQWLVRPSDGTDGASLRMFQSFNFASEGTIAGSKVLDPAPLHDACSLDLRTAVSFQLGDKAIFSRCVESGGTEIAAFNLVSLSTEVLTVIPLGPDGRRFSLYGASTNSLWHNYLGHLLFFSFQRADNNFELWRTDGTPEGTFRLADLGQPIVGKRYLSPINGPGAFATAGGNIYYASFDSSIWVSDGSVNGTYKMSGPWSANPWGPTPGAVTLPDGLLLASLHDYLLSELKPNEGGNQGNDKLIFTLSLGIHQPDVSRVPAQVLLRMPRLGSDSNIAFLNLDGIAATSQWIYVAVETFHNAPLPGGGMTTNPYDKHLLVVESDLCAGDDEKLVPGLCGCGVEESPLLLPEIGIDAPHASMCLTSEGAVLIDPDSVSGPSLERQTTRGATTELALTFDDNILQHMTTGIVVAQGSSSSAVELSRANRSMAKKVQVQHNLRLLRVRSGKSRAVSVHAQGRGRFLVRINGALRSGDRLLFEYGIEARDLVTKARVLSVASLRKGIVRTRRSRSY